MIDQEQILEVFARNVQAFKMQTERLM